MIINVENNRLAINSDFVAWFHAEKEKIHFRTDKDTLQVEFETEDTAKRQYNKLVKALADSDPICKLTGAVPAKEDGE